MGIRTLVAMLVVALAVIGVLATQASYRLFLPGLLQGALLTIEIAVLGSLLAVVMGMLAALARMYGPAPLRWLATVYVEIFRGTSALVQLFWLFFVLPQFGVTLDAFLVAVLALGLNVGAYGSECVRGAIQSVPRGQWEAAKALSLSPQRMYRSVILPQAIRTVLPALGNYMVAMFKDTPVLSAITVAELMLQAKNIGSESFRYLEPITMAGLFFLILSISAAALVHKLELKLRLP